MSNESEHRLEASTFFRRSWSLYDAIVESNHMHHREIYETVAGVIRERAAKGDFQMTDLGCGNARCIEPILRNHGPRSYQGVDLSETALADASELMKGLQGVTWKCADLLEYAETEHSPFEVIFSGFAVHHLTGEEKHRLFRALSVKLSEGGFFLMVDVVREEGMSREDHVVSYTRMMRKDWHGIPAEALEEGCSHVLAYDFPATALELRSASLDAGFLRMEELLKKGPHRVFLFAK
ncbi:MAG: class I SAM-dependent methyltransferase [Proteobacteria bacterium]|nr:class I SAM-dependent methyltransferase [Pseudomonadota bacterium]